MTKMNNLKVILDPCNSPGILSAKIWVRDGSRADPNNQKGIHNLLGSLLTRGCGPYNKLDVADLIEGNGATLICETYEDGLMISLKCTQNSSLELISLLNLMITEPLLLSDQIELERNLSIQAIKRQDENPFNIAFNQWKRINYLDHPYMHETLGIKEDLKKITRADIISLSNNFISRKKIFLISGVVPKNIKNYIQNIEECTLLTNIKSKSSLSQSKRIPNINNILTMNIVLRPQETNQIVLILGKPTISYFHPDDLRLRLLSFHLGYGMSSALFRILREENGLTYDVGLYYPIREYQAPFLIHASSSKDKAKLTLEKILNCWRDTQCKILSTKELNLAKTKFLGNIAHNSQTISQRSERRAHLMGLGFSPNYDIEYIKKINKTTSQEIIESARKHLKNPTLSLCGPIEKLNELKLYWEGIRNKWY